MHKRVNNSEYSENRGLKIPRRTKKGVYMDEVSNLLDAMGALAEAMGFFYSKLLENGFDNYEALELCKTQLKVMQGK